MSCYIFYVENSFSWWDSLFLFFNLKHQIDWCIKHTKYFLGVPCGIHSGLLCYHKKQKQQLLKTAFVTIATKFVSVFSVCHNKWKLRRYSVLLFYEKQLLSKSFSARSVLGKPCGKQLSNIELIDLLPEQKKLYWT